MCRCNFLNAKSLCTLCNSYKKNSKTTLQRVIRSALKGGQLPIYMGQDQEAVAGAPTRDMMAITAGFVNLKHLPLPCLD